jgi:hypothetical protein
MTLQIVQAGDTLIRTGYFGKWCDVVIVERVTKTQIIVDGVKFHKRNGWLIGQGTHSSLHVRWPTNNEVEKLGLAKQRNQLCYEIVEACERNKLRAMPLETLRRINKILGEKNSES